MSAGASHDWTTELAQGEDGLWLFWPAGDNGAYTAHILRAIADHLDRMNSEDSK